MPTLILGSARDIIAAGRPPRAVFLDYPLGHSAGRHFDPDDQRAVLEAALRAFETISEPGQIVDLERPWSGEAGWKAEAADPSSGDVRQPRDETPRYQTEEDRRLAEAGR
jgi:hypothetical protein